VFVVVRGDEPTVVEEMEYLAMGAGPYYSFYRPYHLASIEAPLSVPAAVLDHRADICPRVWRAEVVAAAKRPLAEGEILDGIGGDCVYGVIDDAATAKAQRLVPLGLLEGARVTRRVVADQVLTYDDVQIDATTTIAQLRALQDGLLDGHPVADFAVLGSGRPASVPAA
jgi:predicted homoserine dehydrogenase-like protein